MSEFARESESLFRRLRIGINRASGAGFGFDRQIRCVGGAKRSGAERSGELSSNDDVCLLSVSSLNVRQKHSSRK